ncbi:MAG: TonB-dependent receptor [Bacteroidales bacterium]|nr:TonB-dependent receptor [Bacteroidales bacterium]
MTDYKNFKTSGKLAFRRWSRRKYGAFKTMGQQVIIATAVLAFSLVFEAKTAKAQVDTAQITQEYDMDEVVISGERSPVLFSRLARIVTVLEKEEIEQAPVQDVNGLLEYVLNLDIRQRGNHGVQADISMRGGTFDQTLVLLNGINISDPQTGHHNLNLPVVLQYVHRIEVLKGPASRIFGVNAFNGAINIITNVDKQQSAGVALSGGEYGFMKGMASANIKTGNFRHLVAASHKRSDGYLQDKELNNTDFENTNFFYHGKVAAWEGELEMQAGYNDKTFGANSFYTPAYPNQFEATNTTFASLGYNLGFENFDLRPVVYYRRHQDRFELFRNNPPAWYSNHNHHLTDVWGANINGIVNPGFGQLALGVNYRNEHIYSNVLGEEMQEHKAVPGQEAKFTREDNRNTTSINLEYSLNWNNFHIATGAMATGYSETGNARIYPGLEANYNIFRGLHAFGSYNEAMRLPTYTDLYYEGPTNIGNPHLKPEESNTLEAGLKYLDGVQRIQLGVFQRKGKNIIDWVKETEEEKWKPRNLTEVDATGIDFSWEVSPQEIMEIIPVNRLRVAYSYVDMEKSAENLISRYVLDNLKHKLAINLNHTIIGKLHASWGITYQDRAGGFIRYKDGSYGEETAYEPFWLADARLSWQESHWKAYVEASNIFDKFYYDHGNVPQPGRWIRVGGSYEVRW